MKVRVIRCRGCGAPKVKPAQTAYLYCDYCGRYLDWDFYRAVATKDSRLPGPEYERLNAEISPRANAARHANDRETYLQLQRTLFEHHMQLCPASYSPRIGDPNYRGAMLEYMAQNYTLIAFDQELAWLQQAMTAAMGGLVWIPNPEPAGALPPELADYRDVIALAASMMACESQSFWRLFQSFDGFTRKTQNKAVAAGILAWYPDEVDDGVMLRTAYSVFAEAWLPYLSSFDKKHLLEATGLRGEYKDVDHSVAFHPHNCGRCGSKLFTPDGATTSICETCGHKIDLTTPDIPCSQCGAPVSVPRGFSHFPCPYCRAEIRTLR